MRIYDPFGLHSDPEFDFVEAGACVDAEDPEIFFPTPKDVQTLAKAMEFCMRCDVIDECFQYAFNRPQQQGVWGGTTKEDRDEMRQVTSGTA